MDWTVRDLAKMIDHSLLAPTLTFDDLEKGCRLALEYDVASVCILPHYLKRCAEILKGSAVKASTTIGFPTAATRRPPSWPRRSRRSPTAARSSTWS